MIMRKLSYLLTAGLLVAAVDVAVGAPADVSSCASCHGDNGISKKDTVATIAGLSAP
jgi:cytochrome c553